MDAGKHEFTSIGGNFRHHGEGPRWSPYPYSRDRVIDRIVIERKMDVGRGPRNSF
jgi:hypothetical protein